MTLRALATALLLAAQAAGSTGSVTGVVHDAAGAPVAGIVAIIFPADAAAWPDASARGTARRAAVTDGKFIFASLPEGAYKLIVVAESSLIDWPSVPAMERLAKRGFPAQVTAGPAADLNIEVDRAGSDILMSRVSTTTTQRTLSNGDPFSSAARVRAGPPPSTAPGAIAGRVTDADGHAVAAIEVRSVRRITINGNSTLANFGNATTTDADGRYRLANRQAGTYLVVALVHSPVTAGSRSSVPAQGDPPRTGSTVTFYGNVSDEMRATPVVVTVDERAGTDIQLLNVPLFTLKGSIARNDIRMRSTTVVTIVRLDATGVPGTLDLQRAPVDSDGRFRFNELADGDYDVSFGGIDGFARGAVHVAGRDPDPVVLTPLAPMVVRGQVEFQGATAAPVIPANSAQFTVELSPAQPVVGSGFVRIPIQADGTFTARATGAGPFRLRAVVPQPWVQVAGIVGGVDTIDVPLPFGPDTEGARIVMVDRPSALRVTVVDAQDQPVAGTGVIVFQEDPRYWTAASRRVQTGTTLAGGACSFSGLPPGKYLVATSPDVAARTTPLPALIERLRPQAVPFEVVAGQDGSLRIPVRR